MRVSDSADVEPDVTVGSGTSIWQFSHIRTGTTIGSSCTIGRAVYIGPGVIVGNNVKIQNSALIYEPAELGDGVFVGPAVVLTNDRAPRAVTPDGEPKKASDWTAVGVRVKEGASLGARSVCVAPVIVGAWSMVAAGAVVVSDVADFAIMAGVPARRIGWVGKAGDRLVQTEPGFWRCPTTGAMHREVEGVLTLEEEQTT